MRDISYREIDQKEVEETLARPEFTVPARPPRQVLMRRYSDALLQQEMLLRVVVEEAEDELVVVTAYKTSQISRYLRGLV